VDALDEFFEKCYWEKEKICCQCGVRTHRAFSFKPPPVILDENNRPISGKLSIDEYNEFLDKHTDWNKYFMCVECGQKKASEPTTNKGETSEKET
jgi:hypothetical protein